MSPLAAVPLCSTPMCGLPAVRRGRCAAHMTGEYLRQERARGSSTARGYDAKWRRLRAWVLMREPLCRTCGGLAREADHIRPLAQGGARLDVRNVQPLCRECHAAKTARENGKT